MYVDTFIQSLKDVVCSWLDLGWSPWALKGHRTLYDFGRKTDRLWIWNKATHVRVSLFQIHCRSVFRPKSCIQCAVAGLIVGLQCTAGSSHIVRDSAEFTAIAVWIMKLCAPWIFSQNLKLIENLDSVKSARSTLRPDKKGGYTSFLRKHRLSEHEEV